MPLLITRVSIDDIRPLTTPTVVRDNLQRISQVIITYKSIVVTYTFTWIDVTSTLLSFERNVEDAP